MGIFCEISVTKNDVEYFMPGDSVSGLINYTVDEKCTFNKITVSLKGIGRLRILAKLEKNCPNYYNKEMYVDCDDVILQDEEELSVGQYKAKFNFKLPESIPPSFKYYNDSIDFITKCKFIYYIRIKFEGPGLLQIPKRFKKEITVGTEFTPTLPREPMTYGKEKKIVKLFPGNDKIYLKAKIENSVVNGGESIRFSYELVNDTKLELEGVQVKLVEVHKFNAKWLHTVNRFDLIKGSLSKTAAIKGGDTQNMDFEITAPLDKKTMQNSKIAFRYYVIKIKVILPFFRLNFGLEFPVEIGDETKLKLNDDDDGARAEGIEAPPSYWEAMGECKTKLFSDKEGYTTDEDK